MRETPRLVFCFWACRPLLPITFMCPLARWQDVLTRCHFPSLGPSLEHRDGVRFPSGPPERRFGARERARRLDASNVVHQGLVSLWEPAFAVDLARRC